MIQRIILDNDKALRIFMFPLRQQIMKEMSFIGKPLTPKQLSDHLNIAPSSAKHHLEKLKSLGIVEIDHSELIHGINATFYKLTNVTISIGLDKSDNFSGEREAFILKELSEASYNYQNIIRNFKLSNENEPVADLISGIVHLNKSQIDELFVMIDGFMHSNASSSIQGDLVSHPWEFLLVGYRKDLVEERKLK